MKVNKGSDNKSDNRELFMQFYFFACWEIRHALAAFFSAAFFFQNQLFQKILSEIPKCQTFRIQIRPDILSDLILVQTVCRGYQQTTVKD